MQLLLHAFSPLAEELTVKASGWIAQIYINDAFSLAKVCQQKRKKKKKWRASEHRVEIDEQLIKPPERVHRTGDGWICTVSINLRFPALAIPEKSKQHPSLRAFGMGRMRRRGCKVRVS
jgi:hypothetical protein